MPSNDLLPLESLLSDEDPVEISRLLDDLLWMMVHYNAGQGCQEGFADHYHLVRVLRDTFREVAKLPHYGNH